MNALAEPVSRNLDHPRFGGPLNIVMYMIASTARVHSRESGSRGLMERMTGTSVMPPGSQFLVASVEVKDSEATSCLRDVKGTG